VHRVDGVCRDRRAFDELVRIALEEPTVLERAGLHLVGVRDDVLGRRCIRAHRHEAPLLSGGKTRAAAAAQSRIAYEGLKALRSFGARLPQGAVAAAALVASEVDGAAVEVAREGARR